MSGLGARIAAQIRANGPIGLDRFWELALFDRRGGYYATCDPFGAAGDFTTAPEISQMFGELLGAWALAAWNALGRPSPFLFAEIGPGRGTLMADMLRTVRQLDPSFLKAARVRLVEVSDRLAAVQLDRLSSFDLPIARVRTLAELEPGPLLLLANEMFDAVPIRQFAFDGAAWRERLVGLADGKAGFALIAADRTADLPVRGHAGAVLEVSPARDALAAAIGRRLANDGGAMLAIDYGHACSGFGDTLQALRRHGHADPLASPGEHDITSHVDFERLAAILRAGGLTVAPVAEQGAFLLALGLRERAAVLARSAGNAGRDALEAAVRRLSGTGENEMGRLFKVLAAASRPLGLPPFTSVAAAD